VAGIVVVTFNSADVIDECLDACVRQPGCSVVVVDNASTDETVSRVRERTTVQLIANAANLGFAGAVNQGIAALEDEAVLLLNPDAAPVAGLDLLEQTVMSEGVGAASGRLIGTDGREQERFHIRSLPTAWSLAFEVSGLNRIWPGNPVNRRYRPGVLNTVSDVDQPAGAFLMVRRSAWQAIGGFDEGFFPIWFEDVDFCKRIKDSGRRIVYLPDAIARHRGGHSASQLSWKQRQLFWYGSLLRYASKHMPPSSRCIVGLAVLLASFPRTIAGMLQSGVLEPVSVYSRVVWLAGQCLRKGERGICTPKISQPAEEHFKQSR